MTVRRLEGNVQHYAWGGTEFIPRLLGVDNSQGKPFAELWMGAHPSLPSRVELEGRQVPIDEVLETELPYLLKILSAAKPLSIQAHPTTSQARAGFLRENQAGIPLTASHRNYKDDRHKPELLCALTDFYALRGFRPDPAPELRSLQTGSLEQLYERLMTMPQSDVDSFMAPRIGELDGKDFTRDEREYWLLKCHEEFSHHGHYDRGLFSVFLLNLVHLRPGEAIYLDAGTLHAYLEGTGVEIMASSNNVLRGGLTEKHVDIPELLSTIVFEGEEATVLEAERVGPGEWRYDTPAPEFELRRVEDGCVGAPAHGPEILIVTEGELKVDAIVLKKGQSVWIPPDSGYAVSGAGVAYKATVPR